MHKNCLVYVSVTTEDIKSTKKRDYLAAINHTQCSVLLPYSSYINLSILILISSNIGVVNRCMW